ncbi:hypothetical protein SAMN06295967_1283 [Belliella buryatensis]|uniref:Uncharacterized protein n=1 Tax=Belliella buryatensis TaxID=1500549 RepID=A0A239H7F1_9BACT|nr:hypothetical protein [Belliella buryatensis]SNS77329.1 hypothetical protein SAMN06295967_1283 [Belliella buryatensis]
MTCKRQFIICIILINFLLLNYNLLQASDFRYLKIYLNRIKDIKSFEFLEADFTEAQLLSLTTNFETIPSQTFILRRTDKHIAAFRDCSFDKWIWDEGIWRNIYLFDEFGMNCSGLFFFKDQKCYSIGSYGFWRKHVDLLFFDENFGLWEKLDADNQPQDFGSKHITLYKDKILVFLEKGNNDDDLFSGMYMNWENKSWSFFNLDLNADFKSNGYDFEITASLDFKDYFLFNSNGGFKGNGWYILNKTSNEIRYYEASNIHFTASPFIQVISNEMIYQSPNLQTHKINMEEIFKKGSFVGLLQFKDSLNQNKIRDVISIKTIALMTLFFVVFILVRSYFKQRIIWGRKINRHIIDETDEIIKKLFQRSGQLLEKEELDFYLGIQNIKNQDVLRVTRAKLINEINNKTLITSGFKLINRMRSEDDKRFIYYHIIEK